MTGSGIANMGETTNKRNFLVGCPRSGTTLLQSMLATHSQLASFPESHFLLVTSRTRRGRWLRKLGLVSPEMRRRLQQFLTEVGHPELMPRVAYRLTPFVATFAGILDRLANVQGKAGWLEKTPGHLYYIDDFTCACPDARFIHLIRNGADVVASLYTVSNQYPAVWGGPYTIAQCIDLWNKSMALSAHYCTRPNHLWVSYEKLVAEPALTLADICTFMGIALEAAMLDQYTHQANKLILAHETWKEEAGQALRRNRSARFQQIFTQAQQTQILAQLQGNGALPCWPRPSSNA